MEYPSNFEGYLFFVFFLILFLSQKNINLPPRSKTKKVIKMTYSFQWESFAKIWSKIINLFCFMSNISVLEKKNKPPVFFPEIFLNGQSLKFMDFHMTFISLDRFLHFNDIL